jgi:2-hydroxychromene-2-carboxylate isomerase
VLAARALGAEEAARTRLRRSSPAEGEDWIAAFGNSLGLDGGRVVTLAAGPEVGAELKTGRALADRLGIYGTPGAVLGRTVVVGALPRERWDRLLAGESAEATRAACDAAGRA